MEMIALFILEQISMIANKTKQKQSFDSQRWNGNDIKSIADLFYT